MTRAIQAFLAIVFTFAIALSLAIGFTGGPNSPWISVSFLSMLIPAAGVAIVSIVMRELPSIEWERLPASFIAPALLLMPATMHAAMLPAAILAWSGLPWLRSFPMSAGHIIVNAAAGLMVVSILAFFEEIGWRAWLLPRMAHRMSARCAVAAVAAITALWHVPYALSGIHHLAGVSAPMTALIMLAGEFGAGMVLGCFWIRTRSIWIVSLAHGALNNWGQYAFKFMDAPTGANEAIVLAAGNLTLIALGCLLLWLGMTYHVPQRSTIPVDI
jgi:membrane protease YdiL (CAAX protease family)